MSRTPFRRNLLPLLAKSSKHVRQKECRQGSLGILKRFGANWTFRCYPEIFQTPLRSHDEIDVFFVFFVYISRDYHVC